ncbi:hypothetical protein PQX77_022299 [Marasmius sp. AFHP31]|nr:hypothetical protein PQX77_022299 [Marasmius sp. AFHP31]
MSTLFLSNYVWKAMRVTLFGPASLGENASVVRQNLVGNLWGVRKVTLGFIAFTAVMIQFILDTITLPAALEPAAAPEPAASSTRGCSCARGGAGTGAGGAHRSTRTAPGAEANDNEEEVAALPAKPKQAPRKKK